MSILTPQLMTEIKNIILEELRNNGYAPNPADVVSSVEAIRAKIHAVEAGIDKGLSAVEAAAPTVLTPTPLASVAPVPQVAPVAAAPAAPVIPVAK